MYPELFISYSRVDSAFAIQLVRDLKTHGISVWLDQLDIGPGVNWDEEIEHALNHAKVVLVVLSQHSAGSDNVKNEISLALELRKQVVPILVSKGSVPLMITRLQREDFTGDYGTAFKKLVVRLGKASRTASLAAITPEDVQRISANSAERMQVVRSSEAPRHPNTAAEMRGMQFDSQQESLNPGVSTITPQAMESRRPNPRWMVGAVVMATLVVAVGLGRFALTQGGTDDNAAAAAGHDMGPDVSAADAPIATTVTTYGLPSSSPSVQAPTGPAKAQVNAAKDPKPKSVAARPEPTAAESPNADNAEVDDASASLTGIWIGNTGPWNLTQSGSTLEASMSGREPAPGNVSGRNVVVHFSDDDGCCTGRLSEDRRSIVWSNGTGWRRQ